MSTIFNIMKVILEIVGVIILLTFIQMFYAFLIYVLARVAAIGIIVFIAYKLITGIFKIVSNLYRSVFNS